MSRELRCLRRQARMSRGIRRHLALLMLLGWLSLSASIGVALLIAQGSRFGSAYAATQQDCGPGTGTLQPTPPLEQPSTTVGTSGPGNLACSTITVSATVKPLPTGFVQTPIVTTPNPNGPTSTKVPAGGQQGAGGQSCAGPLCFVGGLLHSAGSWLGHAFGAVGSWLGHAWGGAVAWWNSAPLWAKALVVVGALLVVAAVFLLAVFGPGVILAAIGSFLVDMIGAAGTFLASLSFTWSGFVVWVLRPGLSGLLNGGFTFAWDYFIEHKSAQASFQDAAWSAAIAVVSYAVGVAVLKPVIQESKMVLNLEHGLETRAGENWLARRFGVAALRGAGASKVYYTIGGRLASAGVSVVALGIQVINETYLHHFLPIPPLNPASTVDQIITNVLLLPHAGSMTTQAGRAALDVVKDTSVDFVTHHSIDAAGQYVNPSPVNARGLAPSPTSAHTALHASAGESSLQIGPTPVPPTPPTP